MEKNSAFTLIELLVVIVIIGVLATVSTATFQGSIEKAREAKLFVAWMNDQKRQEAQCIQEQVQSDCSMEIKIGNTTWSRYNTNVGKMIDYTLLEELDGYGEEKVCLENNESFCDLYGGLYTYQSSLTLCPEGWRLPLYQDFQEALDLGEESSLNLLSENGRCYGNSFNSCRVYPPSGIYGRAEYYTGEPTYVDETLTETPFYRITDGKSINDLGIVTQGSGLVGDVDFRRLVRCVKE